MDATVSVVVPVYNQAASLPRTLASLFVQDLPASDYEIIVVDDGSTDGTDAVARRLATSWSGAMRVLTKHNGGPASARNLGLAHARGEIVAFMDGDCAAAPNWLSSLVRALTEGTAAGVGGRIINSPSGNWVATYLDASGLYRHRVRHGTVDYLITPNVAFRRAAFEAVGGFREGPWAEDADLSFRLRAAGHTLLLANDGIVVHYGLPTSVKALAQKLYRYGYGSYAHSHQWASERAPLRELMRHAGAVVLSPLLALRLTQRLGVRKALSSWPLVVVEHSAFCYGLCAGWLNASAGRRSGNGNPKLLGRRA